MRIGIYDPYLDDCGGGEKYMLSIAECLRTSHDVDIFWNKRADFENVKSRFGLDLAGVNVVNDIFKDKFVDKLKKSRKYDAIIFLSDGSIPLVASKKLFLHVQRPIDSFGKGLKNSLKLKKVNRIFVNSIFTKKYIDKDSRLNSIVIYPPVELKPKKINKENIILHVGRFRVTDKTVGAIYDYKKQSFMIKAFAGLYDKLPKNWKFILAVSVKEEDMDDFEILKKDAAGYPIEFVINKNNDELWELYSKAKIYWHASGYGEDLDKFPERAEHFGISTVEAMGAGCVPVVINAGGQQEIVEDGVNGLLWSSIDELESKTLLLISDGAFLDKLSLSASKRAKDFSYEMFCKKIYNMIEK